MKSLKQLLDEIEFHHDSLKQKKMLMQTSPYEDEILRRLKEICDVLVIGRVEPTSWSEQYSIAFGICKLSIEDIKNNKYPTSNIEFSYPTQGIIAVRVYAMFRGQVDSTAVFDIPADNEEYIKKLAILRFNKQKDEKEKNEMLKEEQEKKQLKELLQKYPNMQQEFK